MKDHKLTAKEQKILEFIQNHVDEKGMPPTLREIMAHFGYKAIGTVQDHMSSLERKGVLIREKGKARSIRLMGTSNAKSFMSVPVLGQIAAGFPVLSEENIMGHVPVMEEKAAQKELFAVKVSGESMIEAGIFDGDTAIIEKRETAVDGDIVAIWVDGETTLKEFRKETDTLILIPRNNTMPSIKYTKDKVSEIKILGKMVGLYRKYR